MELKDLTGYTGIEATTFEEFKQKFDEKFVVKSTVKVVDEDALKSTWIGQTLGPVQTRIKSAFGLTAEETSQFTKWEEYVSLAESKVKAKEQELTELSLKTSDGALKELNEKLEKSNKLIVDYKSAAQQAQEALQAKETEFAGQFKAFKVQSVLKDSILKVQPKLASLTEAEQFHMNSLIKENVNIDFDEQDQPIVLNAEGKRWTDPNKAGGFLSPDAVIEFIATEKKYIKKNDAGQRTPIFTGNNNNAGGNQQQDTGRQLHPSALKAADGK